ncbi:NHL repeat-containing protein [Ostreibacterium oceani]|uniref:Uncharacterized protein n=1 Tax=Ostreibacterium oceani TaxID=2654998 RepID=A0A6N7EVY7_9GAMM|nr:hypothetical protein [Ostreibacterium oceani]MPV85589.1 hypothetical protein [Ostreibacterium oceani]
MKKIAVVLFYLLASFSLLPSAKAAFYAVKTALTNPTTAAQNSVLITIDDSALPLTVSTATRITLSGSGATVFLDGLALTTAGQLFGFVNASLVLENPPATATSQLVRIDPVTAIATPIGSPIAAASINGAAFDRSGRLYAINVVDQNLMELDPATGAVLSSLPLPASLTPTDMRDSDLAFDLNNNAYIAERSVGIYPLDVATGTLGAVVPGLIDAYNGLAFLNGNVGVYLEETAADEIGVFCGINDPILLGPKLNLSAPPVSTLVGNAGPMDLAGMPTSVFGLCSPPRIANVPSSNMATLLMLFLSSALVGLFVLTIRRRQLI